MQYRHISLRCFLVIENSGIHQEAAELGRIVSEMKLDAHETLMGAGIAGSMHAVLAHCSPQIFQVNKQCHYNYYVVVFLLFIDCFG